jgi:hypothetical protein
LVVQSLVGIQSITRYTSQGFDDDPIEIQSITLFPDPPKPGEDLTVTVDGIVKETLEVGTVFEAMYLLK